MSVENELAWTRRKFIKSTGMVGLGLGFGLFGSGCSKFFSNDLNSYEPLRGGAWDYNPLSNVFWLGDSFFWAGSLNGTDYSLLRGGVNTMASVVAEISGTDLVYGLDAKRIYALGPLLGSTIEAVFEGKGSIKKIEDEGKLKREVSSYGANVRRELEKKFSYVERAVIGYRDGNSISLPWQSMPLLAFQNVYDASKGYYDPTCYNLIYFDGQGEHKIERINLPSGGSRLYCDPITKDWICYPTDFSGLVAGLPNRGEISGWSFGGLFDSFGDADRLEEIRDTLVNKFPKGYPVLRISQNFDLTTMWIPWADWNLNTSLYISLWGSKLIATTFSSNQRYLHEFGGVYYQKNGEDAWRKQFSGYIIPSSLASSGDQKSVAWVQRIDRLDFSDSLLSMPRKRHHYFTRIEEIVPPLV